LKTYDGREKSLLRGATRGVLPESVVNRVKSPYPSTSDPQYGAAIQAHAKDLFGSGDDALFSLIDSAALEHLIGLDPHQLAPVERTRIERVLDLAVWIDMYKPTIVF
jgi:asparagine synthase (glutamine-hydrolysing)